MVDGLIGHELLGLDFNERHFHSFTLPNLFHLLSRQTFFWISYSNFEEEERKPKKKTISIGHQTGFYNRIHIGMTM